jgi:diguanylate cyclase (GGDEF)-like protein/PAS domain S-box-containing protein
MSGNRKFLSIKWKFAAITIPAVLLLHSIFSYLIYTETYEDYAQHRQILRSNRMNIAQALVNRSFLELEKISESMTQLQNLTVIEDADKKRIIAAFNQNWNQWRETWDINSAFLFDHEGKVINHWGDFFDLDKQQIIQVMKEELPDRDIICPDLCYQRVTIPVLEPSLATAAISLTRSLVDIIIEYWVVTKTDIGVLVFDANQDTSWPYKLSAISNAERNQSIYKLITQQYSIHELLGKNQLVKRGERIYEVIIYSVIDDSLNKPPFFILIDDITDAYEQLNFKLEEFKWFGIVSLVISLALLLGLLHIFLRRISRFSVALPLLAKQKYHNFRSKLNSNASSLKSYDELDQLNQTALTLADQLEQLETDVQKNTRLLTEKSQELAAERDFTHQLIETAPIIIITQDLHGVILSINQIGALELDIDQQSLKGEIFDHFLPPDEEEHLRKLKKLRAEGCPGLFKIDGKIVNSAGKSRHFSWLHSIINPMHGNETPIVLTLGLNVSERKEVEEQMFWLATHDPLTELGNRREFKAELNRIISVAQRYNQQIALFYLDLDQFKIINDSSGHEAGDDLLKQVAKTLKASIRTSDVLCRIGGDEFTLIMPNAGLQGIEYLADKIIKELTGIQFHYKARSYKIGASIGIAIYPQHGKTFLELLSNADLAMYKAKEMGRGQYHVFVPGEEYQAGLTERMRWKEILENAINEDRFVLFYQPILELHNNTISHYECLARIEQEDGQILMPGIFIGYAEELGLIGKIDRIIVNKAIQKHIEFQKDNKSFKLAVNLSGQSFNDTTIYKEIETLLQNPEVDPGQIIFEITETSAVSNFNSAQSLIKQIKALGSKIALDDFGVGFSSFYYLKHLPVDYVKIDGSFVNEIDKNNEDKIFVKAISEVSQALGKKTIAEVVENEEVLTILRELGIDYAQGYHIGKPGKMI